MKKDLDDEKEKLKAKSEEIVNQVITPGFIVEAIVVDAAPAYFALRLHKILAVLVDEYE